MDIGAVGMGIIIILGIVLFILLNSKIRIFYWGWKGVSGVLVACMLVSGIIVSFVYEALGWLIGGVVGVVSTLFTIIFTILKWGLIITIGLGIICFIYSVYQKWKESKFQAEQGEN